MVYVQEIQISLWPKKKKYYDRFAEKYMILNTSSQFQYFQTEIRIDRYKPDIVIYNTEEKGASDDWCSTFLTLRLNRGGENSTRTRKAKSKMYRITKWTKQ